MNTAHPDFDSLKQVESHEKAIVIGSGFGGLASAIRLSAKGYHVTLLEKLDALGGRGYTYIALELFSNQHHPLINVLQKYA